MITVASGRIGIFLQHIVLAGECGFIRQPDETRLFQFGGAHGRGNEFVRFAVKNFARNGLLQNDGFIRSRNDNAGAASQNGKQNQEKSAFFHHTGHTGWSFLEKILS